MRAKCRWWTAGKVTYQLSLEVREPQCSVLAPYVCAQFNAIILTFHTWFGRIGIRPWGWGESAPPPLSLFLSCGADPCHLSQALSFIKDF